MGVVKLVIILGGMIYLFILGMLLLKKEVNKLGIHKNIDSKRSRWRARLLVSMGFILYALFINWDKVEKVRNNSPGDIRIGVVITIFLSVLISVIITLIFYERVLRFLLRMYRDKGIINVISLLTIILPIIMLAFMDLDNRVYEKYLIGIILIGNSFLILKGINVCIFNKKDFKRNTLKSQIYLIIMWFFSIGVNFMLATVTINSVWSGAYDVAINTRLDSIYFTIVTLTTIGYGRIAPVHYLAKVSVIVYSLLNYYMLIVGVTSILSDSKEENNIEE